MYRVVIALLFLPFMAVGDELGNNSGLYCTLLCLGSSACESRLGDVVNDLGIMRPYTREPALTSIVKVLSDNNLAVFRWNRAINSLENDKSLLPRDKLLIQYDNSWSLKSYKIVAKKGNSWILYSPDMVRTLDQSALGNDLSKGVYEVLLVSKHRKIPEGFSEYSAISEKSPEPTSPELLDFQNEEKTTDVSGQNITVPNLVTLGTINPENSTIYATVTVRNFSNQPVQLSRITGTCSCFKGAEYDHEVKPLGTGDIRLRFSSAPFLKTAYFHSAIILSTSDPKLRDIQIKLVGHLKPDLTVVAVPSTTDLGKISGSNTEIVKLFNAAKSGDVPTVTSVEYDHSMLDVQNLEPQKANKDQDEFARFQVKLKTEKLPIGAHASQVIFTCVTHASTFQASSMFYFTKFAQR